MKTINMVFTMTKPMPVGAIKQKEASWTEFNYHIFVVDIAFDHLPATDCQILYNELLPPFIEKKDEN